MKAPKELILLATLAREHAYAPYSGYHTGAALLCSDDTVFTGCNVENAAFSPSVCAERVAFAKAISEGKRSFTAIAIVGGRQGTDPIGVAPCGVCLQVMQEFCDPTTFQIYRSDADGSVRAEPLLFFLPRAFTASDFVKQE